MLGWRHGGGHSLQRNLLQVRVGALKVVNPISTPSGERGRSSLVLEGAWTPYGYGFCRTWRRHIWDIWLLHLWVPRGTRRWNTPASPEGVLGLLRAVEPQKNQERSPGYQVLSGCVFPWTSTWNIPVSEKSPVSRRNSVSGVGNLLESEERPFVFLGQNFSQYGWIIPVSKEISWGNFKRYCQ